MEKEGLLGCVITQNIDNLHQDAGNFMVTPFHGNSGSLRCVHCQRVYKAEQISFDHLPPTCRECGGLLKPDFVFFGESIPQSAIVASYEAASISDVFLIIGTTGEVMPANQFPPMAKQNGARIIEINPEPSAYTNTITDIYLPGKATTIMARLEQLIFPAG
jgi:NAD-dependent deacetylase